MPAELDVIRDEAESTWLPGADPMGNPLRDALMAIAVGPGIHVFVDSALNVQVSIPTLTTVVNVSLLGEALADCEAWAAKRRP